MVFVIQKANLVDIQSSRFWCYSFVFERTQSRLVFFNFYFSDCEVKFFLPIWFEHNI